MFNLIKAKKDTLIVLFLIISFYWILNFIFNADAKNDKYQEIKEQLMLDISTNSGSIIKNQNNKDVETKISNENVSIDNKERKIKVKLNSDSDIDKIIVTQNNGQKFKVSFDNTTYEVDTFTVNYKDRNYKRIVFHSTGNQFKLEGFNKRPSWKPEQNDNVFEGNIIFNEKGDIINEVDMNEYMRGMAEVPESSHHEKRKALAVSIRSYIEYYTNGKGDQKFPGEEYNASDDPRIFQKYLGYNYSTRAHKWIQALKETENEMIFYKNEVLRVPYYSCTLPHNNRTLNPEEANWWGYFLERKEVFQSKEDSIGVDPKRNTREQCGHGVGMSGQGAEMRAQQGKTYKEILTYYFSNIEIKKNS